ncbi:hypothetical protein [Sphingobacterium multivorum]|uniref:hypothetical protein n=1 Tax=Sphingobacterium multivorum TaxID=28454 RepID=UPI0031BAB90A
MNLLKRYFVLIGMIIALIFMYIAISVYPGGTYQNESSIGFDWSKNFFSNLFGEKALNGAENTAKYWAFIGMFFYSISCAVFFVHISKKIPNTTASNFIKYVGVLTMPFTFFIITSFHDLMLAISTNLFYSCVVCITVYVLKSKLTFFKYYCILCLFIFYYATYLYVTGQWDLLSLIQKINNGSTMILIIGLEYFTDQTDFSKRIG